MLVTSRIAPAAADPGKEKEKQGAQVSTLELLQIPLDPPFVTNLVDEGGKGRYIEVGVTLLVGDEEAKKKLEAAKAHMQDGVLGVLASKTSQEVKGEAGKNQLASDIKTKLNKLLGTDMVKQVLITKLVVQ